MVACSIQYIKFLWDLSIFLFKKLFLKKQNTGEISKCEWNRSPGTGTLNFWRQVLVEKCRKAQIPSTSPFSSFWKHFQSTRMNDCLQISSDDFSFVEKFCQIKAKKLVKLKKLFFFKSWWFVLEWFHSCYFEHILKIWNNVCQVSHFL